MSTAIVIGGGITGLCACRLLTERHDDIVLIEKAPTLGGLLKSETNALGHVFDQGTHFITATSIPELNRVMFEDLDDNDCHVFTESLAEGHYFNGRLCVDSGCIDTRTLPDDIYRRSLDEILNTSPDDTPSGDLREHLIKTYGPTLTEHVYQPVIGKFTGMPLDALDPSATLSFGIDRLIVLDRFAAAEVKKSPFFDAKIAWTDRRDGTSDIVKRYPKSGGAGAWIDGLERRLRANGVRILSGRSVSSVSMQGRTIEALTLDDGEALACDQVVWTVPPVWFLKAADIEFKSGPPKFRNMVLLHYSIDAAVNTDLHWVVNFDPSCAAFRITLYPNITTGDPAPPPHHLTVEVMTDHYEIEALNARVVTELKSTGIIPDAANVLDTFHRDVRPGWPIVTPGFKHDAKTAFEMAQDAAENAVFVGRGKNEKSHFMHEVLEDLYRSLH